jgi:GrpB-like predicted nucleotidyltransferase (UPF0157 family)
VIDECMADELRLEPKTDGWDSIMPRIEPKSSNKTASEKAPVPFCSATILRMVPGAKSGLSPAVLLEVLNIGLYESQPATCQDHDPRAAEAAQRTAFAIQSRLTGSVVEHVGSTSVPGCAGKGIIDLMLVYPDGQLAEARNCLDALGFQRQGGRDPWPEERPMRVGSVIHDGTAFRFHVHVISASSPEVAELRDFRDRLRSDPDLVRAYVAAKKAIIATGCTDSVDYSIRKGEFVRSVLES